MPRSLINRLGVLQAKSSWFGSLVRVGRNWVKTQDMVIKQGQGAGLKFQTGTANFGYLLGTSEPQTQDAIAKYVKPGGVFYDLGANVGFLTVIGAKLAGPRGRVVAFEPLPANAELVRHNAKINGFTNVEVLEVAVSASSSQGRLQLAAEPTQAKLAEDSGAAGETISVEIVSIDELVAQGKIPPPDFMKIDIEGAEVDALRGMERTLKEAQPVIILDTHATHLEVAAFLTERGYWCGTIEKPELPLAEAEWYAHALCVPMARRAELSRGTVSKE